MMTLVGAVPPRAFLTWVARSSRRAASGYVPVVLTARVGSPPPTSTTSPGFGPATALVWSWYAGPRVASTVTAVASFIVEAGMAPSPWFWVYSDWPLST